MAIEGLEDFRGKDLLIRLFNFVQKIPYRVCPFTPVGICKEPVHVGIKKGDCRHKTLLLYNLLMERNFDIQRVKVIFDWKDLPIPAEILNILKKSTTRWSHDALKFKVNEHYSIYIDPTWNVELGKLGFPVTKRWDAESNTAQVTNGKLEYFDYEGFCDEDYGVDVDKEEALKFAEALNAWLDKECPIK